MDELIKMFQQQEYERILEEARQKAKLTQRPTLSGSVLRGLSHGYAGTESDTIPQHIGEFLGNALPYALAGLATKGAVLPVAGALGLTKKLASGVSAVKSPAYQALIHGGMTGALAGGARNAESPTERLQNLAVEGTLGALVPAGLTKLFGKVRPSADFDVNVKPEPVPEGWMKAAGRTEKIPGTTEVFAEPDRFYEPGSFSKLLGHGTQLEIPGMTAYSPKNMQAEADMLKLISGGNVQADLPLATQGVVKAQGLVRGAGGKMQKKKVYEIDPTHEPYVTAKPTGEITNLMDMTITPELSGEALRSGMFKEASTMPKQLRRLVPKGPGQAELPFPKDFDVDLPSLATMKGYDIRTVNGRMTLVGPGGKTENFNTLEDAVGFLRLQPKAKQLPTELYGTMDKMINNPPGGKWDGDTFKWTKLDDAALRMQKIQNRWVDTPIGNDISEGIKPLNERMRINVLTGIKSETGVMAVSGKLKEMGYEVYPLVFGDSIEVAYMKAKDPAAMQAFKWYNILRDKGPEGLGTRSGDAFRKIGAAFGKNPEEVENYGWQLLSQIASPERKTYLLGMLETPQFHRSPLFQEISWKFMKGSQNIEFQRMWVHDNFFKKHLKPLSKAEQKTFIEVAEGRIASADAPLKVQDAAEMWFKLREDFAQRLNVSPLKNYFTHKTDYDALWNVTKQSLLDPAQTEMWQKKLGEDGVNALKKLRMQAVEYNQQPWTSIPSDIRNTILNQTQHWDVGSWDKLPPFLRNNLPEEVFNPHLIKRVKDSKIPIITDVRDVLESYVDTALRDINYTPLLKQVAPVINKMGGAGVPGTERSLIEKFVSQIATGTPDVYTKTINNLFNETGKAIGLPWTDPNMLSKIITLYRGREYGGLIGIDTAFRHMNKIINVMAENGMFTATGMKKLPYEIVQRIKGKGNIPEIPGVMGAVLPIEETFMRTHGKGFMDHAIRMSNAINAVMFTPMQMVESGLRSLSVNASLDESLKRGLNYKDMIRLALGRSSSIMPELKITEAQMAAMRNVLRTDFGYDIAHMPPLWSNPLARVSTIFMSYPTKEIEFLSKGISSSINGMLSIGQTAGTAAGMQAFEGAQLFRYLMASGMLFGLPALTVKYMGIDSSHYFGEHMFAFSLPFYQRIMNAYNAIAGDDPVTRDQAKTAMVDGLNTLVIPQYRMGKKFKDTYDSLNRGYKVDQAGHKIATATPWGEIMTYAGLRPKEYTNPKIIANEWKEIAHDYNRERLYATSEFIRTGTMDEIQRWEQKWGRKIEPKDLARSIEISNMPPEKRAQIGMSFDTIQQQLQQKPWLIGGM